MALVRTLTTYHLPLTTHHSPPTTQDPCAEEEALASCGFTVLLDAKGQFCALHKPGGAPLSPELIERSVAAAQQHMPAYVALFNGD